MGLLRTLHAWAGAALSLLLIVLGLTGGVLAFKADWIRLRVPEARAPVSATPAALGAAAEALEARWPGEIRYVVFASERLGVHQVVFRDESQAYAAADGTPIARWTGPARAEAFVYDLHHYLLAGETGMRIAGAAGLAASVLALTGLVVWAPQWRSFRGRLWPHAVRRRVLLTSHRDIGVLFALPVIVFCLTGGAHVFYRTTEQLLVRLAPGGPGEVFAPPAFPGDVDWPKALAAAQAQFPEAELRMAVWPQGPADPAAVRLKQAAEWHPNGRTRVRIDPASSTVLAVEDAQRLGRGQRWANAVYPIHAAAVGGRAFDLVTFASGLALAALGAFGLWSFLLKPRRPERSQR